MSHIKSIIFDLGGVVLNLEQERTFRAFKRLGADLDAMNSRYTTLFNDFETGKIDSAVFRMAMHTELKGKVSNKDIDDAWNAMLLDLPAERFDMIRELRSQFKVYLLSNTNSIHTECFDVYMQQDHRTVSWNELFDKIYYSYEIGLRKPNADIYEYVLKDTGHAAHECIFIDDSPANLVSPSSMGIHTIHAKEPLSEKMMNEIYRIAGINGYRS